MDESAVRNKSGATQWRSHRNFTMELICWTVGLGNCWRFPVIAVLEGGGAFLLPYVLETIFIAIPFSFMELGLGQFSSKGPVAIWSLCPLWKGVGYSSIAALLMLMTYYNVVCSYLLFYFFASMSTVVPWAVCDASWAKPNCFTYKDNSSIRLKCIDEYGAEFCNKQIWENSVTQYWKTRVLNMSTSVKLEHIRWELLCCSSVTALFVFLVNCNGTKSLEKAVPFLTVIPYAELLLLLLVTLIDPGSSRGIKSFLMPDFLKLRRIRPWGVAFEQISFSIGISLGGLMMLGSQCNFRNPVHAEAIVINLIDIASSLCYGITIFNCLGALSYHLNIPIERIISWTDSLLFTTLPLSLIYLPGIPQAWGSLFYSSIYIAGLRSQSLMMTTVLCTIYHCHPKALNYTLQCSAMCSLGILLLGYPFLTEVGSILISHLDNVIAGPTILMLLFLEAVGVMCLYGVSRFVDDMHFMLGFRTSIYWQLCWGLLPITLGVMFVNSIYRFISLESDKPPLMWIRIVQWLVFAAPILLLVLGAILHVYKKTSKKFSFGALLQPSLKWGPVDPILKKSREMFSAHSMSKEYVYRQNRMRNKTIDQDDEEEFD